jgi:crotonobetainyl-CoA:carnitine CoA-transferase CaiB-like acyl-CoA transferase
MDDVATGLHAIIGILLALRARDLTGKGQYIDISMTDSALDFLCMAASIYFSGRNPPRITTPNPSSGIWQTKDGKFICTTNVEPHHWANFCRAIGREDLIPYQYDKERRDKLYNEVREIFLTKTRDEWLHISREKFETQVAPVLEIDEVFNDPQVLHRRMVLELEHPEVGKVRQLGFSIKLSETPAQFRSFAPLPGQHTLEILSQLGYTEDEIKHLAEIGAIC